jgi:hypothetical protein
MAARKTPSRGSKPDKLMADALRVALRREALDADGRPTKRLAVIADQLVRKAMEGDIAAIREVFDRIDGRAVRPEEAQGIEQIFIQVNTGIPRGEEPPFDSDACLDDRPYRLPVAR